MTNEDAISREAVIRLVEQYPNIIGNRCSGLIADIKHLPPITPSYNSVKTELEQTVKGMISDDYKERFIAEYKQLVIRADRLTDIINKARENKLGFNLTCSIELLARQLNYMYGYMAILQERAKSEGINLD